MKLNMRAFMSMSALAIFSLALINPSVDACHRRAYCYASAWCPTSCCVCYKVSEPMVEIDGPFPKLVRVVKMCEGVIVKVRVKAGEPHPTDMISVIQSGSGELKYEGYNKCLEHPGVPGSATIYSIFLCPTKAGTATITVGFVYSDNSIKNVPFAFDVQS